MKAVNIRDSGQCSKVGASPHVQSPMLWDRYMQSVMTVMTEKGG